MENILVLVILFLILLFLGFPVPFALGVPSLVYLWMNPSMPVTVVSQNMIKHFLSFTIISMPAFLFVGRMMNASGVTDKLLNFAIGMVGRFRGGLAHANAFASMLFASMSGTAVGDAGGLGLVEMTMMRKAGYGAEVAAGITAASSILGPIIPPSSAMVLLGSISEISVAALFFGGVIPGVIMCGSLMVFIGLRAHFTEEGRKWPRTPIPWKEAVKTILPAIPSLMTFVIILGSILGGICTPTEAAVLALWYSIFLGVCYKKITWRTLWATMKATVRSSGQFMLLLASASFFTWLLTREGLPQLLGSALSGINTISPTLVVLICAGIFLLIGCFMDTSAAVLLIAPIMMPIVKSIGINPVYFGIVMIIGLMIGIITPPFGICLFVVAGVAELPVKAVTREAIKYIPAMLVTLLLVILFPQIVTWLPTVFQLM